MDGYREVEASRALAPYVETYWIWETGAHETGSYRVLPDGCVDVIFSLLRGPRTDASELTVVGAMTRHVEVSYVPLLLGVRFRPGGAAAFLDRPSSEITDLQVPLTELWDDDAVALEDRLLEAATWPERLHAVERALLGRLERTAPPRDLRVAAAVELLGRDPATVTMKGLAFDLGLSPRQLRRRFRETVGIGPKRLARILRLRRVLDQALAAVNVDWADLALETGFYDQAHLTNEFRSWTGLAPSRYLAERSGA